MIAWAICTKDDDGNWMPYVGHIYRNPQWAEAQRDKLGYHPVAFPVKTIRIEIDETYATPEG